MTGALRLFLAVTAATLRLIARAPLGLATGIERLADQCERGSRPTGEGDPRRANPPN